MNYDVQIGNTIRRGVSYAELVTFPIEPETFVRRANGEWIQAKECVELTHILAQCSLTPVGYTTHVYQNNTGIYSHNEDVEEEIEDCEDDVEQDEIADAPHYTPYNPMNHTPSVPAYSSYENDVEERIFIPTAEYFKCKQKRKAALIGVFSLGLAGLSLMGIGNTWRSNIFAGTSFSANAGIGFVLKCLSFCFLTALIAIPYFIYSVIALIYYSIRINNLKR